MTETAKTYNGWTNYETWNVKLWMYNDQGSYQHYEQLAKDVYDGAQAEPSFTKLERAGISLAEMLKREFEEAWQEIMEAAGKHIHLSSSVWADLMGAALSEVNWMEIANALLEDVEEEAASE